MLALLLANGANVNTADEVRTMNLIDIFVPLDPRTCFAFENRVGLHFLWLFRINTLICIHVINEYGAHISLILPHSLIFPHFPRISTIFPPFIPISTFPLHISSIFLPVSADLIHLAWLYSSRNSCSRLLSKFLMSLNYGFLTLGTKAWIMHV